MVRVLQATKVYYPTVGGVQRVARQIAEECVRRGHGASVVAARDQGLGERATHAGVETVKASSLGSVVSVPVAPTYPVHLGLAKRRADVVHLHLPNPLSILAELSTGRTAPTIVTYHADVARSTHRRALALYRPLLERLLRRAEEIVVTSPQVRDSSSLLEPFREKVSVTPLGIDVDAVGTGDGPPAAPPGDDDRLTLLFVGRLIYYKGLEYAIDAMREVEADLVIAGDGDLAGELRQRARERDVEDRVHFLGYVPDERLPGLYESADVFVFPSVANSEGFGIAQLEAMAHGTPVVNTALETGVPWVSRDGETGLTVPPADPEALAEAIRTLLADEELRRRYGQQARCRVESQFSLEHMTDAYIERYESLS